MLRGAPDPQPGARVVAADQRLRRAPHGRLGLRRRDRPGRDARGFGRDGSQPPEVETHLVNAVLTNGARYYVDHAHPEYSTPECADALELVLCRQGGGAHPRPVDAGGPPAARPGPGDRRLQEQLRRQGQLLRHATRTTSSTAQVPFAHARAQPAARGSSPARCSPARARSAPRTARTAVDFQISQRADFFEEEVGLETTLKRPIVNTRDEPHADPQKYRRLHVIVGDANLCEVATFLKVGTTAIVLAMIEDDFIDKDLVDRRPGRRDARRCRTTRRCRATVELVDGGSLHRDRAAVGVPPARPEVRRRDRARAVRRRRVGAQVLDRWEADARRARARPDRRSTASSTGSPSSRCSTPTVDRDGLGWDDPKLALLDLQYHDVRPERSLYERLVRAGKVERLVDEADVDRGDDRAARHDPGILPGHSASPAGPIRSSPPTGTA